MVGAGIRVETDLRDGSRLGCLSLSPSCGLRRRLGLLPRSALGVGLSYSAVACRLPLLLLLSALGQQPTGLAGDGLRKVAAPCATQVVVLALQSQHIALCRLVLSCGIGCSDLAALLALAQQRTFGLQPCRLGGISP